MLGALKVGNVTNFDLGFRSRDEMVGIRFEGYFDAPKPGKYRFTLTSDDGSRLWIGATGIPLTKTGVAVIPTPKRASIQDPMKSLNVRRLVTIEGRPTFVSRFGKGLKLELRSGQNSISVAMAAAGNLENTDLLNAYVRISGIATSVLAEDQTIRLGAMATLSPKELTIESILSRGENNRPH